MRIEAGERLALPVLVHQCSGPHCPDASAFFGKSRRLWTYILDPAAAGLSSPGARLEIPFEVLRPGPVGARFDLSAPVANEMLEFLSWNPRRRQELAEHPFDLDDPAISASGGLSCTTGDPRFAAQMAYVVCENVYRSFTRALGRPPTFGPWQLRAIQSGKGPQLRIETHSFVGDNAFYDPREGVLRFGFFKVGDTASIHLTDGSVQQYVLSHDVVCHELSHALLDGMRSHFADDTNPDVPAFHEGFADLIAVLHHFKSREHVQQVIERTGGIGVRSLLDFGRILGESGNRTGGSAIRSAMDAMISEAKRKDRPDEAWGEFDRQNFRRADQAADRLRYSRTAPEKPHERGAILVVAVMEAFLVTFKERARKFRRLAGIIQPTDSRGLPVELTDLLTMEVNKLAEHFLNMLIRAIDYCPPVDLTFGEYLRALITADHEVMPEDHYDYRGALIRAFRRRGISFENVLDVSEDSLCWGRPSSPLGPVTCLAYSKIRLNDAGTAAVSQAELEQWRQGLAEYFAFNPEAREECGFSESDDRYSPVVLESIGPFFRLDQNRNVRRGMIAEFTQRRTSGSGMITGGCTMILGADGTVDYIVRKRSSSLKRRRRQNRYREPGGPQAIDFGVLHSD